MITKGDENSDIGRQYASVSNDVLSNQLYIGVTSFLLVLSCGGQLILID